MFDVADRVQGIRLRARDDGRWAIKGSRDGLFILIRDHTAELSVEYKPLDREAPFGAEQHT